MIKNFEEVKKQLKELSQIINSFQSEAVQLRLIHLIFGAIEAEDDAEVIVDPVLQGGRPKHLS